jgi:hypothetical protein
MAAKKKRLAQKAVANTSRDYFLSDYRHTLFPLTTTYFLVDRHFEEIKSYLYKKVLDKATADYHFLPRQRCYAAKRGHHLRRTVKLDPVAEFFIYDVVYRNRKSFRKDHRTNRRSFGYRFDGSLPESPAQAYGTFKKEVADAKRKYGFTLSLDVATYFNGIYHHDLVRCVRDLNWPDADVEALGTFLREANSGRSIDCLPHGLHPCKVLGSEFIRFVDNSYQLRAELLLRFLDDIYLFSDEEGLITADLLTIQELLGERGLSLNESKTSGVSGHHLEMQAVVDLVKAELLHLRRDQVVGSGVDDDDFQDDDEDGDDNDTESTEALTGEQVEYLLSLINSPDVEESDAELVLSLLHDHGEEVLPRMVDVLRRFPGLTKNVYNYARLTSDRDGLDDLILAFLTEWPTATEYQLFWLVKLAEDFLGKSRKIGDILTRAFEHPKATIISRAKVLEIADNRFGLPELREERLRGGRSDWEAWAAAAGTRGLKAASRNHVLSYFANGSQINWLVSECLRRA